MKTDDIIIEGNCPVCGYDEPTFKTGNLVGSPVTFTLKCYNCGSEITKTDDPDEMLDVEEHTEMVERRVRTTTVRLDKIF